MNTKEEAYNSMYSWLLQESEGSRSDRFVTG
jgi:hypothetical protein